MSVCIEGLDKTREISKKILNKYNRIWQSHKQSFIALLAFLIIIALVLIIYPLCYDTIYNCYTDDVLQYYPYVVGFFNKIKSGDLGMFDTSLLAGASFFSSVYYVPLDLFIWIAFLLSYIMPAEVAYSISNILRVIGGSMLIYYVFMNKGFKPRVAFVISIIYCIGGMTETFYIFPVYLGISFYVPLAMLIVDLIIHKDKRFILLIPLFSVTIVLYDFYIAYMLFAFLCIYFLIESHLASKKYFFLATKEFWTNALYFGLMLFIGISMSAFFLFPSSLYIVNETSRAGQTSNDYLWLFGTVDDLGKVEISLRHYFTQWANLFSANTPHNLGLVTPGDYIREHASLYLTTGGAMYLAYFFLVGGSKANRLKPWVILFNLLFCIPLASMIFTFNDWPYVRWFFIPYMINFYAMAIAMDRHDFRIGNNKYIKLLPAIMMCMGLATMLFVLIKSPDLYFHYKRDDYYFNPIVIGSIVFISIFIVLLIVGFILEAYKKDDRFIYRLIPFTIFSECIFAACIAFSTIGSHNYLTENRELMDLKHHLYDLGYDESLGYRINMYTEVGKKTTNANVMVGNTNHARFFQSFYNTPIKDYYSDIHNEPITGWSKVSMHGYTPLSGAMFNMKYILSDNDLHRLILPEELYEHLDYYNNVDFYMMRDVPQFIVYDSFFNDPRGGRSNSFYNDVALLSYGYIKSPDDIYESDDKDTIRLKEKQKLNYDKLMKYNPELIKFNTIYKEIVNSDNVDYVTVTRPDKIEYTNYHVYDFNNPRFNGIAQMDMIYAMPHYNKISQDASIHLYMRQPNADPNKQYLYPFHYNVGYIEALGFRPSELLIKIEEDDNSNTTTFFGFNYEIYYDFINKQNKYTNRVYEMDGDSIFIEFKNNDSSKAKVVKTAYAYSDDWSVLGDKYETCNINGGFLGVIIPEGEENVSLKLVFNPAGFTQGLKISGIGCIIYLCVSGSIIGLLLYRKRKGKEVKECKKSQ